MGTEAYFLPFKLCLVPTDELSGEVFTNDLVSLFNVGEAISNPSV